MRWSGTRPKGCWRKCGRPTGKGARIIARPARQDCGSNRARSSWKNHTKQDLSVRAAFSVTVSFRQQVTIQTDPGPCVTAMPCGPPILPTSRHPRSDRRDQGRRSRPKMSPRCNPARPGHHDRRTRSPGADAVVMVEYTSREAGRVQIMKSVAAGDNIAPARLGGEARREVAVSGSATRFRRDRSGGVGRQKPAAGLQQTQSRDSLHRRRNRGHRCSARSHPDPQLE